MKIPITILLVMGSLLSGLAEPPTWNEIQAGVQAGDFQRIQGWVNQNGLESDTAANALLAAAIAGNGPMLDKLLAAGISANITNFNGASPLFNAAKFGGTEMVRRLLQSGASANRIEFCADRNCKGHTPLMGAACNQDIIMAKLLLEAGADPRLADNGAGNIANQSGDVSMFLLLQKFGGRERLTPLVQSSRAGAATIPLADLGLTELLPGKAAPRSSPTANVKIRLSVIADDSNLVLGDVLNARLSSEKSIELIERQELDRILSEQKLSRQFATDSSNYGRLATLLQADALLLIQNRQVADAKVVECRFIRVNPGLTLDTVYSSAPVMDAPQWAERLGSRVMALAAKVTQPSAIALSLLNIRSSITSSADRGLDRSVAVMLNDRLGHQSHFVLLERSAMERMALESRSSFWTGSYLVDGTIEPSVAGDGTFKLSIRFQPAGAGEAKVFTTSGQRANPTRAVDDLLLLINARLATSTPPLKRDLTDEARCYLEESKWALATKHYSMAQSAAEAAWALGLRSIEAAELRVRAAMLAVRELSQQPSGTQTTRDPAAWLDLGIHAFTVWREALKDDFIQTRSEEQRKWLQLGLELADNGCLALMAIPTAVEQLEHTTRIETLRELIWTSLEAVWTQASNLPPDSKISKIVSEKQAGFARLLFPRSSEFVPAIRGILARKFSTEDTLARARIRARLLATWSFTSVMVEASRYSSGSVGMQIPRSDEASRLLADGLRNSLAPEDRFVAAVLAIKRASLSLTADRADVDRLCSSLSGMDRVLAEGGECFRLYWERFEDLDKLNAVPFFAIKTIVSPDGQRMWDRHAPAHTEFRRQLFLRICEITKAPSSNFQPLLSLDQYTPAQLAEVREAQARIGTFAQAPHGFQPAVPAGLITAYRPKQLLEQQAGPTPSPSNAAPLSIRRLWAPFNLGLELPPEFEADFGFKAWAEGRIWLHGCTLNVGGKPDKHYIFAIDPGSLRTETFPLPESSAELNGRLIVTPAHLLFIQKSALTVRERITRRWDTYKEIHAADYGAIALTPDCVYLVVSEPPGNAVISLNLKERSTEVIASTRRRPAASPFDDPGLEIKSVTTNDSGEIVVVADTLARPVPQIERVSQAWSPTLRSWRQIHPLKLKSSLPRPEPAPAPFKRVGTIGQVNGLVALRFPRDDASMANIPLSFVQPTDMFLPTSRYGPQNIRPDFCDWFDGGVMLIPRSGSGFWIIPQKEVDDYPGPKSEGWQPAQK